ncbi:MAG: hypothetical protein BWY71_01716 [Planctomycetes bacterium ADurb.Bin412]|nr:MAG: hypothetical protein BWY71_01716 [Planctomycetes bacterium ADurb.Bin412]
MLVPQALEIGRQAAGTGGRQQQVAAELKVEGDQAGIAGIRLKGLQPRIGRQMVLVGLAQIHRYPMENTLIILDMIFLQPGIVLLHRLGDIIFTQDGRIAFDLVPFYIIGSPGDKNSNSIGFFDFQQLTVRRYGSTFGQYLQACLEFHSFGSRLPLQGQRISSDGFDRTVFRASQGSGEVDALRPVTGPADHNHLIDGGDEDFAGINRFTNFIVYLHNSRIQVQLSAVVLGIFRRRGFQMQITKRLIRLDGLGSAHHFRVDQGGHFRIFPFEDQAADFRQGGQGLGIVGVDFMAAPEGVFVQLDSLFHDLPEDHRPQPPVTNRQSLHPFRRRLGIPQKQGRGAGILCMAKRTGG